MKPEIFFYTVIDKDGNTFRGNGIPLDHISMIKHTLDGLHVFVRTNWDERIPKEYQYRVINGVKTPIGIKSFDTVNAPLMATITIPSEVTAFLALFGVDYDVFTPAPAKEEFEEAAEALTATA